MLRVIECAASGVLLVIPDDSHVWRNGQIADKFNRGDQGASRVSATTPDSALAATEAAELDEDV